MQFLQPPTWPRPRGYSHGVLARGLQVFVAGQMGQDRHGSFVSMTFAGQARQALQNICAVLSEAGARPEHLVRLTWYVTGLTEYLADLEEIGAGYRAVMGKHYPPMSVVQVLALVDPRAKVEIEATAVIPE